MKYSTTASPSFYFFIIQICSGLDEHWSSRKAYELRLLSADPAIVLYTARQVVPEGSMSRPLVSTGSHFQY